MPRIRKPYPVQEACARGAGYLLGSLIVCLRGLVSERVQWQTEPLVDLVELTLGIANEGFERKGIQGFPPKAVDVRLELRGVIAEGQVLRVIPHCLQQRPWLTASTLEISYLRVMPVMAHDPFERISHDVDEPGVGIESVQTFCHALKHGKSSVVGARFAQVSIPFVFLEQTEIPILTPAQRQFLDEKSGLFPPAHRYLGMGVQVLVQ
jgi:hypothetical protein